VSLAIAARPFEYTRLPGNRVALMPVPPSHRPVVVVGAGLAGLTCARALCGHGHPVAVLEAADGVGGRVRTDVVEGFRLDRGFQVLFTAYPEARRVLDYARLDLGAFVPGALVRFGGRFHRVVDPVRRPGSALEGLLSPVGTLGDKLRVLRLRQRASAMTLETIFSSPERSVRDELSALGFSEEFVRRFFRPFLGGIFLDASLETTSRMFYFVYRMLSQGDTVIPAGGMGAIPAQLAASLPPRSIRLGARAVEVLRNDRGRADGVRLETGETVSAGAVVVATSAEHAAPLLGVPLERQPRDVTCLYYAAPRAPVGEPLLVLDGEGSGPVTNFCVPSQVARDYAPAGHALISTTVLGDPPACDEALDGAVRAQMGEWFGAEPVGAWRLLRIYRMRWAQFAQPPSLLKPGGHAVTAGLGLFVCGDHVEHASINGAMRSGRRAAEAVMGGVRS